MFTPMQNRIMLEIANNGPFMPVALVLWNFTFLPNPNTTFPLVIGMITVIYVN
jgi:hypothetical protein